MVPTLVFRGHIPELDALRAFGITAVIVAHMWPVESYRIWNLTRLTWILMDLFFVMSGFLIAGILLDTRSRPDYYRSFYTRRALRILPVYYAVITLLTCAAALGVSCPGTVRSAGSPWWYFIYMGNVPEAFAGVRLQAARGSFGPLWSLQIEEQFYLLFPLLVHRLRLVILGRTLLGLGLFSTGLRIFFLGIDPANAVIQYIFLPCRMEGLALGALIAVRFRMKPWNLSRIPLTVMTVAWVAGVCVFGAWNGFLFSQPLNRTIGFLISPIACAHVVLWLITFRGSSITACLRTAPVQHLGKISYGAYLMHWPLSVLLVSISSTLGLQWLGKGFAKVAVVFMLTIACASLSWRFFESPMLRLKDWLLVGARRPHTKLPYQRTATKNINVGV